MKTNHLVIILVVISALIFTALFVGYGRNATDGSDTGDASGTPTVTPEDISRTSESEEITSPPEESTAVETEALTEEEITTEITQPEETRTTEVTAEVETTEFAEATEAVETTVEKEPETTPVIEETTEEEETETILPVEETTEVIPEETTTEFKEPTVEPAITETEVTIPIPPEKEHPKEEEITTKAENEYKPPETGDNPFAGGGKTEVKDNPSDNYIGEGEDRPGEGIHF